MPRHLWPTQQTQILKSYRVKAPSTTSLAASCEIEQFMIEIFNWYKQMNIMSVAHIRTESSSEPDFFLISMWARLNLMACFLAATLDSILDYFPSMTEGLLVDSVLRCTFIYLDPFYLKDLLRWISLFIRLILLRSFSALIIIYAMLPPLMWRLFLRPTWINRLFFCLSNKHFDRKLTASWIVDESRFELWPLSMYSSCLYLEPAYL